MKAAFVIWQDRIAPVFDTAQGAAIVSSDGHGPADTRMVKLDGPTPDHDLMRLRHMGVDTLVCGAMSRSMQQVAASCGLRVAAFKAGTLEDLAQAWLDGRLEDDCHAMPGCRAKRHRRRRGHG